MPRALVTGGTGFIGRRVVSRLLDLGHEVTSFSLPGEAFPEEWGSRASLVAGDITEPVDVARAAKGVDVVIHLAAIVGQAGDYDRQWRIIAEGTRTLCEAVTRQGGRAVVVSSIAVYGDKIRRQVCREEDGYGVYAGAYGRAKQGQERLALQVAAETGMPLTIVRPANVYGFGGGGAWGDRLVELFRTTGGAIFGDAEKNCAGLTHVENLADALVLAATAEQAIGRTYNVCDENGITWQRFFEDIARIAGAAPPQHYPIEPVWAAAEANERPEDLVGPSDLSLPSLEGLNLIGFDNRIDASRIREELGWEPRVRYEYAMAMASAPHQGE
ncbi:NAD-dependent epimerase/dehydratase family protein [Sphingomonas arenae]|uniref:NAD-dependent epimerase/dehydratase family protein n=1 Tax=Sphingomonas arenae TaxID=2812555 RepID=UPI001967DF94|nr:NAD(P)-dependent oxidoreductase [Sphingomonas arenae]